jgi:hypothetical protein
MSQTVVVRRIAATPARPAAEAWRVIAGLLAPYENAARQELSRVAGVTMSLIAAEAMRHSPIVVHGVGPRLRVYCLYDEEAILGEGASEEPLGWCPTDGEWAMSLPCPPEDLQWVAAALARVSTRVTARDLAEAAPSGTREQARAANSELGPVDLEAFLRP